MPRRHLCIYPLMAGLALFALTLILALSPPETDPAPESAREMSWLDQEAVIYGSGLSGDPCTVTLDGPISREVWAELVAMGIETSMEACRQEAKE